MRGTARSERLFLIRRWLPPNHEYLCKCRWYVPFGGAMQSLVRSGSGQERLAVHIRPAIDYGIALAHVTQVLHELEHAWVVYDNLVHIDRLECELCARQE